MGNSKTLRQLPYDGANQKTTAIGNKKFHLLYEEIAIESSVEDVWNEVAGNFTTSDKIAKSINSSKALSGDLITGLGAERYLNINFQGKILEVKERIIDFQNTGDQRKFTYDVYEAKGSPIEIKTYNTWSVRKGQDGKTYLGNLFIFRAKIGILTGIIGKKLSKSGSIRNGLLTYKHFLETGEKRVDSEKLNELYPV